MGLVAGFSKFGLALKDLGALELVEIVIQLHSLMGMMMMI